MKLTPTAIAFGLALSIVSVSVGFCRTEDPSSVPPFPQLDVFPPSVAEASTGGRGETRISLDYAPSGSLWGEGLDETKVFLSEMDHQGGKDDSFTLRIGHGGQIYSLRGAFGESVPPSSKGSPWNDEVWQFVSVCTKYNGVNTLLRAGPVPPEVAERLKKSPYRLTYFVHNAGAYIPGNAAITNLYCPLLGSEISKDGRTYRTVNWGLVPQGRTIHRSPILYYCQTRDVGDGVIEMTYVVHNFSVRDDIVFDHFDYYKDAVGCSVDQNNTMREEWQCRYFKLDANMWGAMPFDDRTFRVGRIPTDDGLLLCLFNDTDTVMDASVPLSGLHDMRDFWTGKFIATGAARTPPINFRHPDVSPRENEEARKTDDPNPRW